MAITAPDIKLLESERMADTTDGGGRRTSRVIPDGVAGNIFPKVSRLDSVYGRVNLRKVYGAVQTADVDTYAGSHVVITDAPDNDKIHCTLFSTASEFDTRTAARDRIESYVTVGPESRMVLLGRQLAGQQSVVAYQREEEPLPEIGEVLCLSSEAGSVVTAQQYVRVQTVDSEIRTFTEPLGGNYIDFKRRVITIGTGVSLRYEFNGPENPSQSSLITRPSKLRSTTVVDAARYFGIKPLAIAAAQGDLEVTVSSVYTPIVPTTNRETPLSNVTMGGVVNMVPAKAGTITDSVAWSAGVTRYTSRPITPGTLTGSGWPGVTDDKKGRLFKSGDVDATVDYENGVITVVSSNISGTAVLTYTPAGVATQTAQTIDEPITISNRGTVYTFTLNPLPAPGTAYVDYRALGKWYRLRDTGAGELAGGDAAYGVGSVNYVTGAVVLTLGALPDVGSSVLLGWGSPVHYEIRADGTSDAGTAVKQTITLPDTPIAADSLSLTYTSNAVQYTATDNAAGVITGNGITGTVNYSTGKVELSYTTRLPDANTQVAFAYTQTVPVNPLLEVVKSLSQAASANIALGTPVSTNSFNGSIPFSGGGLSANVYVKDNGAGLLVAVGGQKLAGSTGQAEDSTLSGDQVVGTINYSTGDLVINAGISATFNKYYNRLGGPIDNSAGYWYASNATLTVGGGAANYGWTDSGVSSSGSATTHNAAFTTSPIRVDLTNTITSRIVPGSLRFSAGGKTYIDRNGSLYTDVSNLTGAGTLAGTVDYETGSASLTTWTNGAALALSISAALMTFGNYTATTAFFRTAGSPIRPGSIYVQVTSESGTLLTATSDANGTLTGAKISGTTDQDTGVVRLAFGSMVAAAGNEAEWWYDADNVVAGQIYKPEPIIPSTLTYNAVVLANLPLNADILGLDPVRLPVDGRVPIYRPADVVVIHNTGSFTLPNPVVANAVYNVGRTNLSEVWLVDQAGVKVDADQYIYNLTAGTVTMGAALTLTGLVQPLIAKHRVEDLALLSDVQINGQLTLSAPLSRAYGTDSFVSSAILFGDMNARVENVFDLLSFTAWSNVAGTQSNAQFNDIDYPIEVLNNGSLGERWRISFTSATAFQVIGENLGVITTGTTAADCSPANALTGNPYFVIRAAGWGSGWSAGNQLRFNTIGAAAPIWIARTVLPGATLEGDSFSLQCRGDVDA